MIIMFNFRKKTYIIIREGDCDMIKLITNQCQGDRNDYLEVSEFEDEINSFLSLHPSYKLKKIIYKDDLELLAVLEQTKKQFIGQVEKPKVKLHHVSELINKMESFIKDLKESL
ncbi:MAG TPA: hypothetical protein DHV22_04745 [Xanthomarina gelatinilytica]|uniref:Uncharacterized protein n=1 Tax=Xanthomarina gelatinilytica TaxID=1137281 RepID=A0A3D6BRV3_9FLAO|nr:hypothetical protein [Xanthomarina gelatinilytica]